MESMSLMSLSGNFLISVQNPELESTIYVQSVVFVCEHHEQGSVGLIINRPTSFNLSYIFEQLELDFQQSKSQQLPLMFGGPIQPERGFVLHRPPGQWRSSLIINPEDVTLTTSNDIIRGLAENKGPESVLITLGYSAWEPKQLEAEIMKDYWLVCPFNKELLYDVPFGERWDYAGRLLGIDTLNLTVFPSGTRYV
jgi:putative transcriptional regulator